MKKTILLALLLSVSSFSAYAGSLPCEDVTAARTAIKESVTHIKYSDLFLGVAWEDAANNAFEFEFFMKTDDSFGDIGVILVEKDTCIVTRKSTTAYKH